MQDVPVIIAETELGKKTVRFEISPADRRRHVAVVGKTGTGKTSLLRSMAAQDASRGARVVFFDGSGPSARTMLAASLEYLRPAYWYLDDAQRFAPRDLIRLLSLAGAHGVCVTLACQYLAQLTEGVREAILANVGTIVSFTVGPRDADFLAGFFSHRFPRDAFLHLRPHFLISNLVAASESGPLPLFSARAYLHPSLFNPSEHGKKEVPERVLTSILRDA